MPCSLRNVSSLRRSLLLPLTASTQSESKPVRPRRSQIEAKRRGKSNDDRSTAESARQRRRAEWRDLRREQMHLSGVLPLEMPEYEGMLGHAAIDLTVAAHPDSPSLQGGSRRVASRPTASNGAPQASKGYLPSSDDLGIDSCTTQAGDFDPRRIRSLASSGGGGSHMQLDGAHLGRGGSVLSVVDEDAQVREGPTASVIEHTGSGSADGSYTSGGTDSKGSKERPGAGMVGQHNSTKEQSRQHNGTEELSTSGSREQSGASYIERSGKLHQGYGRPKEGSGSAGVGSASLMGGSFLGGSFLGGSFLGDPGRGSALFVPQVGGEHDAEREESRQEPGEQCSEDGRSARSSACSSLMRRNAALAKLADTLDSQTKARVQQVWNASTDAGRGADADANDEAGGMPSQNYIGSVILRGTGRDTDKLDEMDAESVITPGAGTVMSMRREVAQLREQWKRQQARDREKGPRGGKGASRVAAMRSGGKLSAGYYYESSDDGRFTASWSSSSSN